MLISLSHCVLLAAVVAPSHAQSHSMTVLASFDGSDKASTWYWHGKRSPTKHPGNWD